MFEFKGAIFDLDGTIIDSMWIWEKIDKDFFKAREIDMPEDYFEIVNSMSFEEVAKYTIERFNLDESVEDVVNEFNERALYHYKHEIKLKPYVKEYLDLLKSQNIKIGLATSSPKYLYEAVLKSNGIYEIFDSYTSIDEVTRNKSYPDIYELACHKLGLSPNECIGFEDILSGSKSMKSIGMIVVGVYDESSEYEKKAIQEICDLFIYSFNELLK